MLQGVMKIVTRNQEYYRNWEKINLHRSFLIEAPKTLQQIFVQHIRDLKNVISELRLLCLHLSLQMVNEISYKVCGMDFAYPKNPVLDRIRNDEFVHLDRLCLADTVHPIVSLLLCKL